MVALGTWMTSQCAMRCIDVGDGRWEGDGAAVKLTLITLRENYFGEIWWALGGGCIVCKRSVLCDVWSILARGVGRVDLHRGSSEWKMWCGVG